MNYLSVDWLYLFMLAVLSTALLSIRLNRMHDALCAAAPTTSSRR